MARLKGISKNLSAFLDMLSVSEGTSTSPITKDDGYDVIVTGLSGREIFTDYTKHPFTNRSPKKINLTGLYSTASGRYQHMRVHWAYYKALLNLKDFGPESQDRWAIQLIKERGALPLIEAGKFDEAVKQVRNLWASLPGAGYGQPEHSLQKLRDVYILKGGKLWDSKQLSQSSLPPLLESLEPSILESSKNEPKPVQNIEQKPQKQTLNALLNLMKKLFKRN